ncbi:hypothetical protein [Thiohalomonas denitrificans]|uniref:Uncharacterized protein n=1 Tax=Thiohalomonas denitrificans TaxID=415747 RepID=A0A1G5QYC9_9GAMM|nr:hypothetical protein [Thiohalomonas denitrificans]SCZ66782.1 hypothetical protein SAMN03097708_03017 [Thiohalomonas denitrificans]
MLIPVGLLEIVLFWGALFIAAQSGIASFVDLILLATVLFLPLAMFPNRLLLPEGPGRTVKALLLSAPFPVLLGIGGGLVFGGSG